jgi:FK506-binding protein 4/5
VNAKGLFRRSQAYLKTSELQKAEAEAEADIKKALAIDPNNRYV